MSKLPITTTITASRPGRYAVHDTDGRIIEVEITEADVGKPIPIYRPRTLTEELRLCWRYFLRH